MDLASALIGAVLITICVLPFVLMARKRKKIERQMLQALTNLAARHNCQVSQHEICGDFGIGIDDSKKVVLFYKQSNGKVVEEFVDLAEIQSCQVKNTRRPVADGDIINEVVDKLELNFIPRINSKLGITLEFFNLSVSGQLNGELQSIDTWSKLFNDRIMVTP